ncbi:MAG: hypothetical protein JXB39_10035 [Deltaproteobacteria bacterium]|nr:hypothetical protein [Deltaproteobacteria bacterium]
MTPFLFLAVLLPACGNAEDTGFNGDVPDIRGYYNVFVVESTGCEGHHEYLTEWAEGPLTITGNDPRNLTYTFTTDREDLAFPGQVDDSWSFQLAGAVTWTTASKSVANLSVYEDGMFSLVGERYHMDGEFEVVVDDDEFSSNDCTLTAVAQGTQISD